VQIHRWGAEGLEPLPWGIVVGEPTTGLLGQTMLEQDGELLIGATISSMLGLEVGAVYRVSP
jgi:hypothetical protein